MPPAPPRPLSETELAELQDLLDALPAPLEPLDLSALDGYLVGVLLQPRPVPAERWWRHVPDVDGRDAGAAPGLARLQALVRRRHAELDCAIERRDWFDPWVFEPDAEVAPAQAVLPWVAGFATAMAGFPALLQSTDADDRAVLEPLAILYAALDPADLEDADALLAEIETLEPPSTMAEAVEDLVRASLLLADISRPRQAPRPPAGRRPRR